MIAAHISVDVWQGPIGGMIAVVAITAGVVLLLEYGSRWRVAVSVLIVGTLLTYTGVELFLTGMRIEKEQKAKFINRVVSEWLLKQGSVRYRNGVLVWDKVEEGTPVIKAEITAEDFEEPK